MKQITTEELKSLQIDILKAVDAFCIKNSIHYWMDCGTLLGAVRHGGYIPWDDDIDIGMLREDYDRFIESFNKENDRYRFKCLENSPDFLYPSGKVLDTKTVLYEPDRNGQKISVNIDVFVYDLAPSNPKKCESMYNKRDFLRKMQRQRVENYKIKGNPLKVIGGNLTRLFVRMFPRNYFVNKMVKNSKKYKDAKNFTAVGNFTSYARIYCPKELVNRAIRLKFEDCEFNAPIGYDDWLKAFYKDYMKLPPEEKRVPHHSFEAYIED